MRVTKKLVLSDSNKKFGTLEEFLIYLLWFETVKKSLHRKATKGILF